MTCVTSFQFVISESCLESLDHIVVQMLATESDSIVLKRRVELSVIG